MKKIFFIYLFFFSFFVVTKGQELNHITLDSLEALLQIYYSNPSQKKDFFEKIRRIGIKGDGYINYDIPPKDKVSFYRILAALDYEKDDFHKDKDPLDFLHEGMKYAKTETDTVSLYKDIVLAYFMKIVTPLIYMEERKSLTEELESVYKEIDGINSSSEVIQEMKHVTKHNMGIVYRFLGRYTESEKLLEYTSRIDSMNFGSKGRKIDFHTNSINELGRTFMTKGIEKSNNEYIEEAIKKFEIAISRLESSGCSPPHLKELYIRQEKAYQLLNIKNETLKGKISNFIEKKCYEKDKGQKEYISKFIINDYPNLEGIMDFESLILVNSKNRRLAKLLSFLIIPSLVLLLAVFFLWMKKDKESKKLKEESLKLTEEREKLRQTLLYRNILQKNSSSLLQKMNDVGNGNDRLTYLDAYLPEVYSTFKEQIEENSALIIILFDRKNNEIFQKRIFNYLVRGFVDEAAKIKPVDERNIYYSFYRGRDSHIIEGNYMKNFQKYNIKTTIDYIKDFKVTTESIICVPLKYSNNKPPMGILSIQSERKDVFEEDHLELVKAIANMFTVIAANFELADEREEIEARREEIEKQKNQIIKVIDHRFRNYIDINEAALQNIKRELPNWGKEALREKLIKVGGDTQILKKTLRGLLRWMEILGLNENPSEELIKPKDFSLWDAINIELEQLYFPITEHEIVIDIPTNKIDAIVQGIPQIYIGEIVSNLIINSIQHLRSEKINNPKITIDVNMLGEFLILSVSDNGNGMSEGVRANMFNLSLGNYDKKLGRGFGSMAIKKLVDKFEGKAKVLYSNSEQGTKIEISIPAAYIKTI